MQNAASVKFLNSSNFLYCQQQNTAEIPENTLFCSASIFSIQ